MAAQLINGNGFEGCTAQVDADFYEGIFGTETGILTVGQKMKAEMVNNQPRVYDGVILTKEGRRIQIDYGAYQDFTIPAGTTGVTAYYIIGFKLVTNSNDTQTCEPFVRAVSGPSTTIPEGELRTGAAEVYVSVYRVTQVGTTNILGNRMLEELSHLYGKVYRSLADVGLTNPTSVNVYYKYMADNSIAILTEAEISDLPYDGAVGNIIIIRGNLTNAKALFLSQYGLPNYEYSRDNGHSGTWVNGWQALPQTYTKGQSYRWSFAGGGYITGGGKSAVFAIPLNKSLANISGITPNGMNIKVRQRGEYIAGTAVDSEGVDSVSYRITENCVIATATMTNGYSGAINNEACGVEGYCDVILT